MVVKKNDLSRMSCKEGVGVFVVCTARAQLIISVAVCTTTVSPPLLRSHQPTRLMWDGELNVDDLSVRFLCLHYLSLYAAYKALVEYRPW
jgi:hypothetical protein